MRPSGFVALRWNGEAVCATPTISLTASSNAPNRGIGSGPSEILAVLVFAKGSGLEGSHPCPRHPPHIRLLLFFPTIDSDCAQCRLWDQPPVPSLPPVFACISTTYSSISRPGDRFCRPLEPRNLPQSHISTWLRTHPSVIRLAMAQASVVLSCICVPPQPHTTACWPKGQQREKHPFPCFFIAVPTRFLSGWEPGPVDQAIHECCRRQVLRD